jgi:type IV pilus assembly protein PilQ
MTTIRAIPGNELDANGDQIDIGVSTGFTVEVPNVAVSEAATTVTIPDKGSLLVGGFQKSVDQFTASRVPLLGSIPFLGRLFGARGRYSDRTQLVLLSTVTILNYPELEAAR